MSNNPKCNCSTGWYDAGDGSTACLKCAEKCGDCIESATNCTVCLGNFRKNNFPDCTCESNYYDDGLN